ncbi:MAG: MFS transporter [Marinilabiliaceae bacterium]|jgi:cyanate permease|nr:MFS transporter [Marinilabiliaceae bacterium]
MQKSEFRVYPYRWIMLLVFMLVVAVNQLLWITFAPVTNEATLHYGVSDIKIGMLSMCFMIVYLLVSVPASWLIDTYGIKIGVGTGVVLTGIFGLVRGLVPAEYNLVLLSQIGIATGQPFILNSITKVAGRWFPVRERATAAGMGTLAMYIGIMSGMILTPYLVNKTGIDRALLIYGIVATGAALIFLLLARERPATAPCRPDQEERALAVEGLKLILQNKGFLLLMFIFFIGLGVFNAVTTWIENILSPKGFTSIQAGTSGGLMIIGGIVGAIVIPLLSDRFRNRTIFIMLALAGSTLGLAGITFATTYSTLLISAAIFGFFLLSSGPIGFQYGAEITYPVSEGTSNGFLLLMGQVSGIAFIFGMDAFKAPSTGSMTLPLVVLIVLMGICFALTTRLKESDMLSKDGRT